MAGAIVIYCRNYDSSDTTTTPSGRYTTSDPLPTIEACGWEPPSGYQFKEWNTARDGSGASFQPGDTLPSNDSNKYAIWEPIPVPYLVTSTDLTAIADAIRTKGGTSASLTYPTGFVSAINAIPTGGDIGWVDVSDHVMWTDDLTETTASTVSHLIALRKDDYVIIGMMLENSDPIIGDLFVSSYLEPLDTSYAMGVVFDGYGSVLTTTSVYIDTGSFRIDMQDFEAILFAAFYQAVSTE